MKISLFVLVAICSCISVFGLETIQEKVISIATRESNIVFCPSDKRILGDRFKYGCYDDQDEPIGEFDMCMKFKDCAECPENGICDNEGKMTCETGFIREK